MHFSGNPDTSKPTECIAYEPPAPSYIRDEGFGNGVNVIGVHYFF